MVYLQRSLFRPTKLRNGLISQWSHGLEVNQFLLYNYQTVKKFFVYGNE